MNVRKGDALHEKLKVWFVLMLLCAYDLSAARAGEGEEVLSSEIKAMLTSESYIYVATRRLNGEWSTAAPVWFMYDGEAVYFSTSPSSHKAHRIHRGSPVRVWVGQKDGPVFEGETQLVKDRVTVERMSEVYRQKYWIARFGLFRPRPARVASGKTVVVKVTPVASTP
jgi:nitroimidazol reductase NimA-like FMN-containing flavoprotein (pyridoxamine 5'-phosphate oxidase superfamily)